MIEFLAAVLFCFAVKQRPDTAHHDAKLALQERGQSHAFVSAVSTWASVSPSSPVPAGNRSSSESSTRPLGQSLAKAAVQQPDAFLQEGAAQSESIRRQLHQASPSSAAAGSSLILVRITLSPFLTFLFTVVYQFQVR